MRLRCSVWSYWICINQLPAAGLDWARTSMPRMPCSWSPDPLLVDPVVFTRLGHSGIMSFQPGGVDYTGSGLLGGYAMMKSQSNDWLNRVREATSSKLQLKSRTSNKALDDVTPAKRSFPRR